VIWGTGVYKTLAQVTNKQLVYFVSFQLLFVLMTLKQEQESTSSPQILKRQAQAFQFHCSDRLGGELFFFLVKCLNFLK